MEEKDYYKLTENIPEIKVLLNQEKELKKELNRVNRRLKTYSNKYKFLKIIISENVANDLLEEYVKLFFKEIGFEKVHKVGKQLRKEDLRIIKTDKIIIAEVTGSNKRTVRDSKTMQITKHLSVRKSKKENAYALFIINHSNNVNYKKRNEHPFTENQIQYAETGKYSLVTTTELVKGFMKVKLGKMNLLEFEEKLCEFGLVKF